MTTILAAVVCGIAVTASYFNTSMGLALLALPSLGVAIPALAALKTARWDHVPELSPQANALLKKYGHFYSMPFGSADFASAANVVSVSAVLIGLWGLLESAPRPGVCSRHANGWGKAQANSRPTETREPRCTRRSDQLDGSKARYRAGPSSRGIAEFSRGCGVLSAS